ncbi:hypothetical protein M9434_000176 [Picochlorum sp. BPE23]|nr:hypothetical protein M9434_000176 [Picochlorum sp. BPE23]
MVYCKHCRKETDVDVDDAKGISCCVDCGSVLEDVAFSVDVTFQKDAAGESTVVGQFVNESGVARGIGRIHGGRVYAYQAESHERAQQRGRQHIAHLVDQLKVKPREESIDSAHRVYKLALQKGFTRGRRTSHVAAACLYLLCRQDDKPFFLIDFSDILQVSVFSLGAVFLQLAKLLRLENQPQFTKPVDPSLYIHRFADKMGYADDVLKSVSQTAMRLVASMKRDWIQTGRRPSGVCGAALYIATHLHGEPRTKRDIVNVVHIGEFTLSKRLNEFATTPAGEMNKKEFLKHSEMMEKQEKMAIENARGEEAPKNLIGGCMHLSSGVEHFRNGLCRECYLTYVGCSGGYEGANPPSFSKNREREKVKQLQLLEDSSTHGDGDGDGDGEEGQEEKENGEQEDEEEERPRLRRSSRRTRGVKGHATLMSADGKIDSATVLAAEQCVEGFDVAIAHAEKADAKRRRGGMSTAAAVAAASAFAVEEAAVAVGESRDMIIAAQGNSLPLSVVGDFATEDGTQADARDDDSLSDISDSEILMYIAEEEEVKCKEEIWNMMNQDWMEKQAAKAAAQEAALQAQEEQRKAMEQAAAAGVQYKRGRGRPLGSKSKPKAIATMPPAETPQEAAMRIIDDKKLSSKINYSVLAELFSSDAPEQPGDTGKKKEAPKARTVASEKKAVKGDVAVDKTSAGLSPRKPRKNASAMLPPGPSKRIKSTGKTYQRLESLTGTHASPLSALSNISSLKSARKPMGIGGIGAIRPKSSAKKNT